MTVRAGGVYRYVPAQYVQTRDGQTTGRVVGTGRRCQLEGCLGWRVAVRWPDGRLTRPCSKGLTPTATPGTWRIQ